MINGDIVKLKSGGEKMVIVNMGKKQQNPDLNTENENQYLVEVKWVDSFGILNNEIFNKDDLIIYN